MGRREDTSYLDPKDQELFEIEANKYMKELASQKELERSAQEELERRTEEELALAKKQLEASKTTDWANFKNSLPGTKPTIYTENAQAIVTEYEERCEMAKNCKNLTLTNKTGKLGVITGSIPAKAFPNSRADESQSKKVHVEYDPVLMDPIYVKCKVEGSYASFEQIKTILAYEELLLMRNRIRDQQSSGVMIPWQPNVPIPPKYKRLPPAKS